MTTAQWNNTEIVPYMYNFVVDPYVKYQPVYNSENINAPNNTSKC